MPTVFTTIGQYRELAPLTAQWVVITSIVILSAVVLKIVKTENRLRGGW